MYAVAAYLIGLMFGLFLGLVLCPMANAASSDWWLSPYFETRHHRYNGFITDNGRGEFKKFSDSHPALGIEHREWSTGIYADSYGGTSAYLSRHWSYRYGLGIGAGALIGAQYEYLLLPFVGPEFTVEIGGLKLKAGHMPGFGIKNAASVSVLQFAVKI